LQCAAAGADFDGLDAPGAGGRRALHEASTAGNRLVAEWLLQNGARADHPDGNGRLASALAKEAGHDALADMLQGRE